MKIKLPDLAPGEIYVGCIGDAEGNVNHIILLPGENDAGTANEWAKSIGGELPSEIEHALLFTSLRSLFEAGWYMSREDGDPKGIYWAKCRNFCTGVDGDSLRRARAIRRVPVETA